MLQTKHNWFRKQLQPKSQNRYFHTPAAYSLLLQKQDWLITTQFMVEGHIYIARDLHTMAPCSQERVYGRQFVVQWINCK